MAGADQQSVVFLSEGTKRTRGRDAQSVSGEVGIKKPDKEIFNVF